MPHSNLTLTLQLIIITKMKLPSTTQDRLLTRSQISGINYNLIMALSSWIPTYIPTKCKSVTSGSIGFPRWWPCTTATPYNYQLNPIMCATPPRPSSLHCVIAVFVGKLGMSIYTLILRPRRLSIVELSCRRSNSTALVIIGIVGYLSGICVDICEMSHHSPFGSFVALKAHSKMSYWCSLGATLSIH